VRGGFGGMSKRDTYKKLDHFSKKDIIEALCRAPFAFENTVDWLLEHLEQEEWRRLRSERDKANDSVQKTLTAYIEWEKAIAKKHGDGKSYNLMLISDQELKTEKRLSNAYKAAIKHRDTISKKIDKHLKMIGGQNNAI
jgi:hypothetical protein